MSIIQWSRRQQTHKRKRDWNTNASHEWDKNGTTKQTVEKNEMNRNATRRESDKLYEPQKHPHTQTHRHTFTHWNASF